MTANPSIRPARLDDMPAIVAMRDQLNVLERAGCAHASIQPLTLEEFTRIWAGTLESPNHCWRIAEQDGKAVGFGLIYLTTPQVRPSAAYVHWAFVEPGCRRSGLGQALLDQMLAWAKSQGANRVELQFIDGNTIAQRFWTKMGFRPFARKCVLHIEA